MRLPEFSFSGREKWIISELTKIGKSARIQAVHKHKMHFSRSNGFTLVELIVAIGLMSIFVVITAMNSDILIQRQKREKFLNAVDQVLTAFRSARAEAISNALVGGSVPAGGYGVYIHRESLLRMNIVRFADDHDETGAADEDGNQRYDAGFDTIIEEVDIDTPWTWAFENTDPIANPTDDFMLIFYPPEASLRLFDGASGNEMRSTEIRFDYNGGATVRRICFNRVSRFFEVINANSSCF